MENTKAEGVYIGVPDLKADKLKIDKFNFNTKCHNAICFSTVGQGRSFRIKAINYKKVRKQK